MVNVLFCCFVFSWAIFVSLPLQLCIKHIAERDLVLAGGCRQYGDVAHTEAIDQARQLGTQI